jgi:hypothetical protein
MTPVSGTEAVRRSPAPADTDDIDDRLPSRALWRDLAGAAACAVLGVLGFTGDGRVPVLVWINLAIHEFGHVATYAFPEVVTAMMGSITQVALPLAIAGYFLHRRELVSAMLCLAWAGTSAHEAGVYIGDAPYQRLELIGGYHDWAFVLGPENFDAMDRAAEVARLVNTSGIALVVIAVAGCLARPILWGRAAPRERAGQ